MAGILHIGEMVVTDQVLRQRHAGQAEVLVAPRAVVTPSGWDYLRDQRLQLRRGDVRGPRQHPQAPASSPQAGPAAGGAAPSRGEIPEVLPPGSDAGVLSRGRYEHPDRAFGCRTEEFGSGFVEPSSCGDCAVQRSAAGSGSCACDGCNKAPAGGGDDLEALVQRLTDEIMARLGGG